MFDVESFYDSISLSLVARAGLKLAYPGRRSGDIVRDWWTRRSALDAVKPTRICSIEFGSAEPTQVRSLTRHSISFKKPPKPKTHSIASGSGGLCHDPGFRKTRSWVSGRQLGSGVLTEACTYIFGDGSGTHSDPRIRRVGWSAVIIQGMSNCLGQTLDIWKRHSERLMNSLKPRRRLDGPRLVRVNPILWAGRSSWHALWQLRAREAMWSTSRTTKSSRKGKIGVGPHRVLGKAATLTSGGGCPGP